MKIVFGKSQFWGPISGADEILTTNATQLRRAGHCVSVLLLYPFASGDQYYLRLRDAGVPISTLAHTSVHASLGLGRRLARQLTEILPASRDALRGRAQKIATGVAERYYDECCDYLRRTRPDLLHVITPDPGAMLMIRAAHAVGVPTLYQEVGTPYHPPGFESYYQQFTTVLPLCSEVAALSPQLARQCREKLPLTNALSVLPIITDESPDGVTGRSYDRNGRGVTFGFAARLEPLKGPLVLVEAFAAASRESANIHLKIAGIGSQQRKVIARARKLDVATSCDLSQVYTRPEEKSAFMQSVDVFVLPSLTEGTPCGIVEAMAHGLPVIATNVGGIPDIVTPETGVLVSPEDAEALAQAMSRLAADPDLRMRMGRAAKERSRELFSPGIVLPLMLNTYRRVAARSGNGSAPFSPNGNGLLHPWAHTDV